MLLTSIGAYLKVTTSNSNQRLNANKIDILNKLKLDLQETDYNCESGCKRIAHPIDPITKPLILTAEVVCAIKMSKGDVAEVKQIAQLKAGESRLYLHLASWYKKHLQSLDWILFTEFPSQDVCSLGIDIQAFISVRKRFTEEELQILRFPYQYTSSQKELEHTVAVLNRFADAIRAYFEHPDIKKKLSGLHANLAERKRHCIDLIMNLMSRFSKQLIVRVDLPFARNIETIMKRCHTFSDLHSKDDLKALKACVKKLLENRRHNKILDAIEGYILRFEYSVQTGFHVHAYFMFDGNKHREDISLGQYIAKYWDKVCGGQGSTFICNMKKDEYKYCGIGMLHYHDEEKLAYLINTFNYICKSDQFFKFSTMVGARAFQFSQQEEKTTNAGRPRNHKTSSVNSSQLSLVFAE